MVMSMRQTQSVFVQQQQRQTQRQKISMIIAQAIITPSGICPSCGQQLTEKEMRAGWLEDPDNTTTECPQCNARFEAWLIVRTPDDELIGQWGYLCEEQLFSRLSGLLQRHKRKNMGIVFLEQQAPGLLFNIIRHFGTYELGFKEFKRSRWGGRANN